MKDNLVTDNTFTLTPVLHDELFAFVETLYILEKTCDSDKSKLTRDMYRNNIIKYFKNVPNLDEEIDKMLEELREKDKSPKKESSEETKDAPKKDEILEQVINDGEKAAHDALYGQKQDDDKKNENIKYNLTSKFIHSDVTGEIYDQRNLSVYKKAVNIARSTGEMVDLEDKEIVEARHSCADNYISNLPESSVTRLQRLYGDDWKKVIRDAYESGFKIGTKVCVEQATKEGTALREKDEEIISKKEPFPTSKAKVDLEELKFCYEGFSIHKKDKGFEVVDKDGKVINNPRTRNMVMFANQWVAASKEIAFSETGEQLYSLIQSQAQKDLEQKGIIDVDNLQSYANDLGDKGTDFSKITTFLFKNDTKTRFMDSYFRMQTPKAIPYPPVSKDSEEEKTSSK